MNDAGKSPKEVAQELERLERELLDPAVRRDRNRVAALLEEEFLEFGSSGRVWTRNQILDLLATEDFDPPAMEAFDCRLLAKGVALVTYRTVRTDPQTGARAVNRSSIWIGKADRWRMRFHQGTLVPPL